MRKEIERVEGLTEASLYSDYIRRGRPVIISNEPTLQKAVTTWSLDYLAAKHPHHRVPVEYYPCGDQNQPWTVIDMEISQYVEHQKKSQAERKKYFLMDQPLQEIFPNTATDIPVPPVLATRKLNGCFVYIGVDTYSPVHYHRGSAEALLTQIVGKKRARLYPASEFRRLYPKPWFSPLHHTSAIPFQGSEENVLWARYPRLAEATVFECTVTPGDMLFIPQGWFHIMEGFDENVSVTFFFEGTWRHGYLPLVVRDHISKTYHKLREPLRQIATKGPQSSEPPVT